jgi:uncharacterized protein (UPF0332 family)
MGIGYSLTQTMTTVKSNNTFIVDLANQIVELDKSNNPNKLEEISKLTNQISNFINSKNATTISKKENKSDKSITYYINKISKLQEVNETIEDVSLLIKNSRLNSAVNRIYYGMYYILSALAIKDGFITSKHAQLLGWFNKNYIKNKIIDKKYSKLIQKAFDNRMEGDYDVYADFIKEEVEQSFEEMKDVISEIRKLV